MEEKEEMAKVFVVGHRNPDTDSICSAIAYADIKNRTSQKVKYIPKRASILKKTGIYRQRKTDNIIFQIILLSGSY